MAGTIVIQAAVEEDLNEEEQTELKRKLENSLEKIEEIEPPEVFYKQQTGTRAFGFVVNSELDKLAANPADGRYLAIFIRDSEEEIISEKFILNPALKVEKGKFGMAMSILQRNGVKEVLLPEAPSGQQEMVLKELGLDYRSADFETLAELRNK